MAYTNYGYESRLTGLRKRLGLSADGVQGQSQLADQYNPGRQRLASDFSRQLTDNKLYERANPYETGRAADGSIGYGVQGQYEGQAYRDARTDIANATAARGSSGSSAANRATTQAMTDINNQRDAAQRGFADQQAQSFEQQQQAYLDYAGQLSSGEGEYRDWQAGQAEAAAERNRQEAWQASQAAIAATPEPAPYQAPAEEQPTYTSPTTPTGKATYTLGGGVSKASLARARQAQAQRPGYKLERRGGSFVLVRR